MISKEAVREELDRFIGWLDSFGEISYDHQSYFAGPIGRRAKALYYKHPKVGLLAVAPMILSEAFLPAARRLFWKMQRFPIADAHYAMGFAIMARQTGLPAYLRRAVHFLEVLEKSRCGGYDLYAWGYPFDWVTRTGVMRAGTPLITTTPYVYEAFAMVHEFDNQPRWVDFMGSIAEHVFRDIPTRDLSESEAAAGYNPHDMDGCVINASAYRAFLLLDAAARFDRRHYREAAKRNLNFVLRNQQPDGSWRYATDGVRDFVDHFHTCFVLKALAKIELLTNDHECSVAIASGVRFYVERLFDDHGRPKPFATAPRLTVYRQELYDMAECVNLGTLLKGRFPELDAYLQVALKDLMEHWRKPDGSFRSRRLIAGWDNVPMHRWAQAQAFRALAFYWASMV